MRVAELIGPHYKTREYGKVLLPMTVLRRLDVNNELNKVQKDKEKFLQLLKALPDDQVEILTYLGLFSEIDKLEASGVLYMLIEEFAKLDLSQEIISNNEMGYIFESIMREFMQNHISESGEHFTPPEVINLATKLLLNCNKGKYTVYDPTCGTGGYLHTIHENIKKINSEIEVDIYGQEINDETYAICKADTVLKGLSGANIKLGCTLTNDKYKGYKFDYIVSNPPFGVNWNAIATTVKDDERFKIGIPATTDGQMLFLLHVIDKMHECSRATIVLNGSPLFNGDAGSGPSEIRKYIIENDLLETIIALPENIFYNTGITTYLWVLSKNKESKRKNKIQLIDASKIYEKIKKPLGEKRNEITPEQVSDIFNLYNDFIENSSSRIMDSKEFGYKQITIERPKRDDNGDIILKKGKPQADSELREVERVSMDDTLEELELDQGAWVDHSKTKIGYEINLTQHFYVFESHRSAEEIKLEYYDLIKRIKDIEWGL